MAKKQARHDPVPALEWIAAGLGALVALALFAAIGSSALRADPHELPRLSVEARRLSASAEGYTVEFRVRNAAGRTAKGVEIEGTLGSAPDAPTAAATLDYVPARSKRDGAMVFSEDPRGKLELRVTGYQLP